MDPSEWAVLENKLLENQRLAADDVLVGATLNLLAILQFLNPHSRNTGSRGAFSPPQVGMYGEATRSLYSLYFALKDTVDGSRPALLFNRERKPHRAGSNAFDELRAVTATCLEMWCRTGLTRQKSATKLAELLKKHGIKHRTRRNTAGEILAKQLMDWHSEMGANPGRNADRRYGHFLNMATQMLSGANHIGDVDILVSRYVQYLADTACGNSNNPSGLIER
jgi:hypothetical protein